MTLIEQIKRDREAGTAGGWVQAHFNQRRIESRASNLSVAAAHLLGSAWRNDVKRKGEAHEEANANARRIARVPQLEAALLAAEELAKALEECVDAYMGMAHSEFDGVWKRSDFEDERAPFDAALTAFRKACEVEG